MPNRKSHLGVLPITRYRLRIVRYWAAPMGAAVLAVLVGACSQPPCVGCTPAARPTATGAAATRTAASPTLAGVSPAELAQSGIRLQAPTGRATVSKSAAQRTALRTFPGITAVRNAVLADFANTHRVPPVHALSWAFSLAIPPGYRVAANGGAPPGNRTAKLSYLVVFINAKTGAFIQAMQQAQPANTGANNSAG